MLNPERDHVPRPASVETATVSINAMAFAKKVAAEYKEWKSNNRNGLYAFFGRALMSYRKFLKDPGGYDELLGLDNISGLREKPDLKTASRLVRALADTRLDGATGDQAALIAKRDALLALAVQSAEARA